MLEDAQVERYSRQIILPQVGGRGQEKMLRSRVYVDGEGPLAAAALFYLVAAGVGTVGAAQTNAAPVFSALAHPARGPNEQPVVHTLRRLNPDCAIVAHLAEDTPLAHHYDLVLATTDALHDECYAQRKPFVWAAAKGGEARVFISRGDRGAARPCLRCLLSESIHPPAARAGHAEALPAAAFDAGTGDVVDSPTRDAPYLLFLGAHLVTEALKIILQPEANSPPKLAAYTFPAFHCTERTVEKNPHCPVCATPARNV